MTYGPIEGHMVGKQQILMAVNAENGFINDMDYVEIYCKVLYFHGVKYSQISKLDLFAGS